MNLIEKIISGSYSSIFNDKKFDYEFILADKDAVFILPVIDNNKIILRQEPVAAYHYYQNDGETVAPESTDKHFTLAGGGIEKPIDELSKLSDNEYMNIVLENAERECWEELGIQLKDNTFKNLYHNAGKIHNIGPIFTNKYNSFRVTYLLVFFDSDEIIMKKPPTDGSDIEKLSDNVLFNLSNFPFESMKNTGDVGMSLVISELQNMLNLTINENKYKKFLNNLILATENVKNNRGYALVVGRFQPFTNGHLSMITELFEKARTTVIIGIVEGAKSSKDKSKNPLDFTHRAELIKTALSKTSIPYIIIKINSGYLPDVIEVINNTVGADFGTLFMACGSDRFETYSRLLDKAKEEFEELEYELIEIERVDDDISASKIRDAIKSNDYVFYRDNVPAGLRDEGTFERLKGMLLMAN